MASVRIAQLIAKWVDASGKSTRSKINLDGEVSAGVMGLGTIQTKAATVVTALEAGSKLKYVNADVVVPVTVTTGSLKSAADATATALQQGYIEFSSELGTANKPTHSRFTIPAPKSTVLAGNADRVNLANADITTLTTAIKDNCLSMDGRALTGIGTSGVRIRVTRK